MGLNNLTSIFGNLDINWNNSITSLYGLESLTSLGGNLHIDWNDSLTSLYGIENLTSIGGNLKISDNESLLNFLGLNNLTSILGRLHITLNNSITSLYGLESLTFIGGYLYIKWNDAQTSLYGIENLTSIGGDIEIAWSPYLNSLEGLDNVTSIGGDLNIRGNDDLTSLSGIENIAAESIENIEIIYNNQLSECHVLSICDYLAAPNGTVEIHSNYPGCNTQTQVEEACAATGLEDIIYNTTFSIYPNPATKEVVISTNNDAIIKEVNIYNQVGQKIIHKDFLPNKVDVSMLQEGMYVIELVSNEFKIKEKLIIE